MATWRDGPAYAPKERPVGFAQPSAAFSLAPPPAAPAPPPAPLAPPLGFQAPATSLPPLASLAARPEPGRDPTRAFDVVTTVITQPGSAWGSVHNTVIQPNLPPPEARRAWQADQPWQSQYAPPPAVNNGFPAPGTPQWFATGPVEPAPAVAPPVTVMNVAQAVGFPYLIVLFMGLLLAETSAISLALAFACVQLTRSRRKVMRFALGGAWLFAFAFGAFGNLVGLRGALGLGFQLACLLAIGAGLVVQYIALRAGDRPDRRY
jgi:hypothetical protein